jgi:hypothetical protein
MLVEPILHFRNPKDNYVADELIMKIYRQGVVVATTLLQQWTKKKSINIIYYYHYDVVLRKS